MKVLTRYLLRAHIGPFLFAFVALTGVILINTLAKELANLAGKGLPLSVVLEFFVLSLPANIALTLPMAVLVSVLYTFSTLASENEITALRASGVDLRRAAVPIVVAAALIAGGMIWFSDQVLPASNYRWRVLMTDVAGARPLLALREQTINPIRTGEGATPYYLEAQTIDAETGSMHRVSIYDVSDGRVIRTINADSGRMAFNPAQTDLLLTLFDGNVREVDFNDMSNFQIIDFERQIMRMEGVSDRMQRTVESTFRTDRDMTLAMMRARIDTLRVELAQLRAGEGIAPAEDATVDLNAAPEVSAEFSGAAGHGSLEGGLLALAETEPAPTAAPGGSNGTSLDGAGLEGANPLSADLAEADRDGADRDGADLEGAAGALQSAGVPSAMDARPAGGAADAAAEAAAQAATDADAPAELSPSAGIDPDRAEAAAFAEAEPIAAPARDRFAEARARNIDRQIREFQVEIQKKYSIAVATLVFVLIGIPIALRFPQGGIGMVIGISLAIFGIYYVGLIGGENLGDRGYIPPLIAMWLTNTVFGLLGLFWFFRLGREHGTTRGGNSWELPRWLRTLLRQPGTGAA